MGEYYDSGESVEVGADLIMYCLIGLIAFVSILVVLFLISRFTK